MCMPHLKVHSWSNKELILFEGFRELQCVGASVIPHPDPVNTRKYMSAHYTAISHYEHKARWCGRSVNSRIVMSVDFWRTKIDIWIFCR